MCLIYHELPIMHVDMSDNDCNLDDQIQNFVTVKLNVANNVKHLQGSLQTWMTKVKYVAVIALLILQKLGTSAS